MAGRHFSGQITLIIMSVDDARYYTIEDADKVGPAYHQTHTVLNVSGEAPEGESLVEAALEEALALAMAKRQGDN